MHVKKGDNVIVLAGKDKGKKGKILKAFPRMDKVLVEGVNAKKVHQKATRSEGQGQVVEKFFPIHVSNVKLADSKQPTTDKKKNSKKVAGSKS